MAWSELLTVELRKLRSAAAGVMARWSYALTVITTIVVVVAVGAIKVQFLPELSNLVFDWYQRLDHRVWNRQFPVRIVDIDDESIARIGQWPWPRSTIAEIVKR